MIWSINELQICRLESKRDSDPEFGAQTRLESSIGSLNTDKEPFIACSRDALIFVRTKAPKTKMSMNVDPIALDGNIADVCEKLSELFKREKDIKASARTDVDVIEKDNLLRKMRVERRDLNRQLAELSVQKSLLENNVGEENDPEEDDEVEEEDAEEFGAADVQELEEDKTDEYHRLHNLLV